MNPSNDTATIADEAERRARPVIAWLMDEERLNAARMAFLFDRFARRLRDAGLPVTRASLHIQQLHPQLASRSLVWDWDSGGAVELGHEYSIQSRDMYLASPVRTIREDGGPVRCRIERPECALDYPIVADLKARGFTDYTMRPLAFSGGIRNAVSIATDRSGGFTELDLAVLDATLPAFAAIVELQQTRRTARDLLSTYVGPNTGERIFSGAVKRGDGEIIHSVLWYCDLRGFTALSETRPLPEVIALLNNYFDRMAEPVVDHGGEILKFIGDAMLAIFPCTASEGAICDACDQAVAAAEAAIIGVEALSRARTAEGKTPVHCGVAVHVGEVMYGNVGAADRLDFTVIGPAVNLVSRLDHLSADLGQPIVVSASVTRASRRAFRSLGRHKLKGIAEPQEAFTLA
ncbi:MAG: adenylate/guanylate cyclase domain-containing protein [Proteobacteria bacterium]|nr:adenylate/guanylate cyclase domain-containing protein [Pseudomonadota bacterium]